MGVISCVAGVVTALLLRESCSQNKEARFLWCLPSLALPYVHFDSTRRTNSNLIILESPQ